MRLISVFLPAILLATQVHAQSFESFLAEVADRPALVESFLDSTTAPHFENDETAVFLWLGEPVVLLDLLRRKKSILLESPNL